MVAVEETAGEVFHQLGLYRGQQFVNRGEMHAVLLRKLLIERGVFQVQFVPQDLDYRQLLLARRPARLGQHDLVDHAHIQQGHTRVPGKVDQRHFRAHFAPNSEMM